MTLAELRSLLSSLTNYDLDNYQGESPTEAQLNAQINWALRAISKEIFLFDPNVELGLVAGQARYSLDRLDTVSKRVVRPLYVTINQNKLWNAMQDGYGMWGFEEFVHDHPTWESASSGTPTKAVSYGAREILLHLPPNATVVASGNNRVAGQVIANDLTGFGLLNDPSDQGVPVEMHEGIAQLAAIYAASPNVTEREGLERLARYDAGWKAMAKVIRNENHRMFHSGTRRHGLYADWIRL